MRDAAQLAALAKSLHLNERQRKFAEALAADPERNQTRAAITAGLPTTSAPPWASVAVRLAKVQEYMAAITGRALERRQEREVAKAQVTLDRVIDRLAAQMDLEEPAEVVHHFSLDGLTSIPVRKTYKPQAAALGLATILAPTRDNPGFGSINVYVQAVAAMPAPDARGAYLQAFGGNGGNGNGHGQP